MVDTYPAEQSSAVNISHQITRQKLLTPVTCRGVDVVGRRQLPWKIYEKKNNNNPYFWITVYRYVSRIIKPSYSRAKPCAIRVECCPLTSRFEYTPEETERRTDRHQTDACYTLFDGRGQRNEWTTVCICGQLRARVCRLQDFLLTLVIIDLKPTFVSYKYING